MIVFCTPMIGDQNEAAGKGAEHRADGIGRVGTADAAADAVKALGEQAAPPDGNVIPSSTVGMNMTSADEKNLQV